MTRLGAGFFIHFINEIGNPVRAIDTFVDHLDLAGLGFERVQPQVTGRPGYDPASLPKIYVYGYLKGLA